MCLRHDYTGSGQREGLVDKQLARELRGYEEYRQKVRWRLVPFVW